ncbi:ankyrin repeat-containing protein [Plakobranchus ocellatus]|uniref:Ankyrin repeat-containing protein n=1 Tax=Plakobranchus ocellatus TaxID=259542 RepID=A0AAV4DEK9_9GAST|nr:ankyrin repeat-containing protein [Plakobranchus ocellatus]
MFFHCLAPRDLNEELLAALKYENLYEVEHLLNKMEPIGPFHIPTFGIGKTLSEACRASLQSCVVKRLHATTNLDPKTCQRLLRPAIVSGSIETVEALLKRGANLNLFLCGSINYVLTLHCNCNNSVLVVAITYLENVDLMNMVKFLVEKGANVNGKHKDRSPLLVASLKETDVALYLLQNGADVNEVGDNSGNTPLIAAVFYEISMYNTRRCSIVEILLSAGADPNKRNNTRETALHLAPDSEIAKLLIEGGAGLEARDHYGRTPLLVAASKGRTDVIILLKKYGADMAAVDNKGNSALHIIVNQFHEPQEETFRLFALQCNQRNKDGATPLMLAAQMGDTKAVRILLELGADPNIVVCRYGRPETALSFMLNRPSGPTCAVQLITHNSVISLPRCRPYFFNMINRSQDWLVQLMVSHGMVPLCENTQALRWINGFQSVGLRDTGTPEKLSPLAFALVLNKLRIAQYLTENWFLTPADLVGSMELRHLRCVLERESQADSLRFMNENLSQPMSLLKLSFVAVSAQLGGVAGREERVSQTALPNILKNKLLFRC